MRRLSDFEDALKKRETKEQDREDREHAFKRYENEHPDAYYTPCGIETNPFLYER